MQIVIDIPEEKYKHIQEEQWLPNRLLIEKAIANGIPLEQIRAEIDSYCSDNRDRNDGLYIAMRIIDKHTK